MRTLPAIETDVTALNTDDFLTFAESVMHVSDTLRCILRVTNSEVESLMNSVRREAGQRGLSSQLGLA